MLHSKIGLVVGLTVIVTTTAFADPIEKSVAFKVPSEDPARYLTIGGKGEVSIQGKDQGKAQVFILQDLNGGELADGDDVRIKQFKYLCEKGYSISRTSKPDDTTRFKVKRTDGGILLQAISGKFIAAKSVKEPLITSETVEKALVFEIVTANG